MAADEEQAVAKLVEMEADLKRKRLRSEAVRREARALSDERADLIQQLREVVGVTRIVGLERREPDSTRAGAGRAPPGPCNMADASSHSAVPGGTTLRAGDMRRVVRPDTGVQSGAEHAVPPRSGGEKNTPLAGVCAQQDESGTGADSPILQEEGGRSLEIAIAFAQQVPSRAQGDAPPSPWLELKPRADPGQAAAALGAVQSRETPEERALRILQTRVEASLGPPPYTSDTPRPPPRTNRTRRVPHPVLIGHAASCTPCSVRAALLHPLRQAAPERRKSPAPDPRAARRGRRGGGGGAREARRRD